MKSYLEELEKKDLISNYDSSSDSEEGNKIGSKKSKNEKKKDSEIQITKTGQEFLFKYLEMKEFEKTFGL